MQRSRSDRGATIGYGMICCGVFLLVALVGMPLPSPWGYLAGTLNGTVIFPLMIHIASRLDE